MHSLQAQFAFPWCLHTLGECPVTFLSTAALLRSSCFPISGSVARWLGRCEQLVIHSHVWQPGSVVYNQLVVDCAGDWQDRPSSLRRWPSFAAKVHSSATTIVKELCVSPHTDAIMTTRLLRHVVEERAALLCENPLVGVALCCVFAVAQLRARSPSTEATSVTFSSLIRIAAERLDTPITVLCKHMILRQAEREATDIVSFYNRAFVPAVKAFVSRLSVDDFTVGHQAAALSRAKRKIIVSSTGASSPPRLSNVKRKRYEFGNGPFSVKCKSTPTNQRMHVDSE